MIVFNFGSALLRTLAPPIIVLPKLLSLRCLPHYSGLLRRMMPNFSSHSVFTVSRKNGGVSRPFCLALFGTQPNDLVQFDYLELGFIRSVERYVVLFHHNHSSYSWFYISHSTDAAPAANALLYWSVAYRTPSGFMSNRPTHFKTETWHLLPKVLHKLHHFTLSYFPLSNGAVERLVKKLIRVALALLSEIQMRHNYSPQLVSIF